MDTIDNVSPKLRKVEKEIDDYYKSNPLIKLPFATAAWSLLAFAELKMLWDSGHQRTSQELETMSDNFVNDLKEPMAWLLSACKPNGQISFADPDEVFQASGDLFELGKEYQWFEAAYTYASRGWIKLELQGTTIQPTKEFFKGMEYRAYGRLMKAHESDKGIALVNRSNFELQTDIIRHSVKVEGDRFRCKLNPKIVSDMIKTMRPGYDIAFSLPPEWQFNHYSLGDFRRVFEAILAIAFIYLMARGIAIEKGCDNMGYLDSIYMPTHSELKSRVVRYSGVSEAQVQSIFDDLTYGNRGIKHPDPALQPLIKLDSKHYAIMPSLWINLSPERNLTVLLNKLPSEKKIYRKLVGEKEALMRKRLTTNLPDKDFRFICGNVVKLPDVDLAIIRDSEKACFTVRTQMVHWASGDT